MPLRFDTPHELKALMPRLSHSVNVFSRFRGVPSPEARVWEIIPLYALASDADAIEPSGDWYLRVSLEEGRPEERIGVVASWTDKRWRIDTIEEKDTLGKDLAWLDDNMLDINSTVGFFRDFNAEVASLYLVDVELHRVTRGPTGGYRGELVPTARLLEVVRQKLADLEVPQPQAELDGGEAAPQGG